MLRPQSREAVARALSPASPCYTRVKRVCAVCGFRELCVSKNPALCSSCASALECSLKALPVQAKEPTFALVLRCVSLPPEDRAPLLAVLKQMGVQPRDVVGTKYRRLEVRPRCSGGLCVEVGEVATQVCPILEPRRFARWSEVVAYARLHKAALRAEAPDLAGNYTTYFEHLVGLPQAPMFWEGAPLQLSVTDVRGNVVVCVLHTGDLKPLVPEVLRSVLSSRDCFGELTVAASGYLVATRRFRSWSDRHKHHLRVLLGRLAAHGLISHATGDAFAGAFPWGDTEEQAPAEDLQFALECLGTHAGLSYRQEDGYHTMKLLAPALLAVGCRFDGRTAVGNKQSLSPWSSRIAHIPLHELVRSFGAP